MRLMTFSHDGLEQVGVRLGDHVIPVGHIDSSLPSTLIDLIATGSLDALRGALEAVDSDALAT